MATSNEKECRECKDLLLLELICIRRAHESSSAVIVFTKTIVLEQGVIQKDS